VAVFVLVWLVLRTRVHALIAMLAAACIAGLLGGMGIDKTLSVTEKPAIVGEPEMPATIADVAQETGALLRRRGVDWRYEVTATQ
ncbi:hypothetical protein MJN76_31835, partial [Salmonella enterica subsp. enterica serovar Anatum]|nr:hypothetical protein [Salmonella enterica subsp. enterica serovar Anatum]